MKVWHITVISFNSLHAKKQMTKFLPANFQKLLSPSYMYMYTVDYLKFRTEKNNYFSSCSKL